ncbi:MAG TPA: hypothetical protein VF502_09375 [Stellaceae bacterium]
MSGFVAVVLICQTSLAPGACTEATARDVMAIRVDNELGCANGWQDVVARSAFADDIGKGSYVKTLCRRAEGDRRSR